MFSIIDFIGLLVLCTNIRNANPGVETRQLLAVNSTSECADVVTGDYPIDLFNHCQRRQGAVILHLLGVIYMFLALAIVCDEYFVPSLEIIADKLQISEDVAGATLMAAGGSAPELFTSIVGVFLAKSNVGIGTIVGSAVFNLMFVISICTLASTTVLVLSWWPLFRDVSFYIVSLVMTILFFRDGLIYWWEALILFVWYILYVVFMKFNSSVESFVKTKILRQNIPSEQTRKRSSASIIHGRRSPFRQGIYQLIVSSAILSPKTEEPAMATVVKAKMKLMALKKCENNLEPDKTSPAKEVSVDLGLDEEQQRVSFVQEGSTFAWPKTWLKRIAFVILLPITAILFITIPDIKKKKFEKYAALAFISSILSIAMFSYLMVWWANQIGLTLGIPNTVMGLTILAAGTSIPDLISSYVVAKKGFGDMAVSSSVGSNIFDSCVGLPFPWLIYWMVFKIPVNVNSNGLICSISLLLAMLVSVTLIIAAFRWKLSKILGMTMMFGYAVFIVLSLLLEYRIIKCQRI